MIDYSAFVTPKERAWQATYAKNKLDIQLQIPKGVESLLDFFEQVFARHQGHTLLTCMGVDIGYNQLDGISQDIAAYLQSLGLVKGDKVAVMMPNCPQYLAVMIGIVRAGLVLVNINPLYTASELEHQLLDSDAKALFIIENFAHTFAKTSHKGQIGHVIVTGVGDMLGAKGWLINLAVRHIKKNGAQGED